MIRRWTGIKIEKQDEGRLKTKKENVRRDKKKDMRRK